MAAPDPVGKLSFAERLRATFRNDEPLDEAARALIDKHRAAQQRIEAIREETKRSVRSPTKRFHL